MEPKLSDSRSLSATPPHNAQLEQTFEPTEPIEQPTPQVPETPDASQKITQEAAEFSLSSFEDAIADLEQFIQSNQSSDSSQNENC